jgi:thiamine-phosphate pyrophosphorylase
MSASLKKIKGGLYLVVDPMPGIDKILPKIKAALDGGVDVIQLWNHWAPNKSHDDFIIKVCEAAHVFNVPVLIHEQWQWMNEFPLDGVHFETIPNDIDEIHGAIGRPFISGITCGNDEERIHWAIRNQLDYVSFCSMYSSSTANSCELVRPGFVKQTCQLNELAVYVAGGITLDSIPDLLKLGISGVAVVSAIMNAADPTREAIRFKALLSSKSQSSVL